MPPKSAIWIAIPDSVTVSIGDETNGALSWILRVRLVESSMSSVPNSMCPGSRMRSSYV